MMPLSPDDYAAREDALEERALDHARDVLRANSEGALVFDDATVDIRYIIAPETGRLTISTPIAATMAGEVTLWVPVMDDDALQLLLSVEEAPESADTDRWQAWHGEPGHVRWGDCWIDSAKHGPWVFDGDALMLPNALRDDEAALCRELNASADRLRAICRNAANLDVEAPRCVGVDPNGLHVRAKFGVVRIGFQTPAESVDQIREIITRLAGGR